MNATALAKSIADQVDAFESQLIAFRRHLHQYPELGFQEGKTMSYIAETLRGFGLQPQVEVAGTGVVVDFPGNPPGGRKIGFRVDIDALPIEEKTGAPYASRHPGVMHACGHDAHAALGLGVAYVLSRLPNELAGDVRLFFQPAEELFPGGADAMIAAHVLQGLEALFGVHVDPSIPAGRVGVKYGAHLASVDTFQLEVIGQGGHAAHPHLAVDPIPIAAQIILALQTIASRKVDPVQPVVVSVTMVQAGTATNIIPTEVSLQGTFRTLSPETREMVPVWIDEIAAGVCSAMGGSHKLRIDKGSPVLVNDAKLLRLIETAAADFLPKDAIVHIEVPRMGSEDFANYLAFLPGAMLRLGTNSGEKTAHSLHSPHFDLDERALALGVKVLSHSLLRYFAEAPYSDRPA